MEYETITIEALGGLQEHIILTREDGSVESFPADSQNPRYIQFLKEQG